MGAAGIALAAFLAFSFALTWVAGDKQKERLEDTIAKVEDTRKELQTDIGAKERLLAINARQIEELQRKYKKEVAAKKRIARRLALEKRKQRMAAADLEAAGGERSKDLDKMRAALAAKNKEEIARLEKELAAAEEAKKKLEAEMRVKIEEEVARQAKVALEEAERARVKAEKAAARARELQERLKDIEAAKEAMEKDLMEMARVREAALDELEMERRKRSAIESRLLEIEASRLQAVKNLEQTRGMAAEAAARAASPDLLEGEKEEAGRQAARAREKMDSLQEEIARLQREKAALSEEASGGAEIIGKLQEELAASHRREAALKSAVSEQQALLDETRTGSSAKNGITGQPGGAATAAKKVEAGERTNAEAQALRSRAEELASKNRDLKRDMDATKAALAEAAARSKAARELIARNTELEMKLKEAGLVGLQGQAASYVAQKIIERNAELEQRLVTARINLARAEAARSQAESIMASNSARATRLNSPGLLLATGRPLTTATELELKLRQAEEAIAQAEAARFVIGELQARNIELTTQLKKGRGEKVEGASPAVNLERTAMELAGKLREQAETARVLESRLEEALLAKEAGEQALQTISSARLETEKRLEEEARARAELEKRLAEALKAAGEKEGANGEAKGEAVGKGAPGTQLQARLTGPAAGSGDLKASRERAAKLTKLARRGTPTDMTTLRTELADLKDVLNEKLRSGEMSPEEVISFMEVDSVISFYVVQKGDSLWKIAGRSNVYGNPFMWPLLYRYNLTKIDDPDIIDVRQVIVIYKDITQRERSDAIKKAHLRGDWRNWSDEEKRAWIEDWVR